ncbi:MAG: lactonase family protein [Chloroflexi bacterium]|nr:lactonase family protein [Chloroflexota bacterium]
MPQFMYVSVSGEDKVLIFTLDGMSGRVEPRGVVQVAGRPSPMAMDPQGKSVYISCREVNELRSFRIDSETGGLSFTGKVSPGSDAVFVTTDRKGRFVLSSYNHSGNVAVHPIGENGAVGAPPVEWVDTAKGAHSVQVDPSNRFVLVPHTASPVPSNMILQFKFDEATGHLTPNSPFKVVPEGPSGPRHLWFHPKLNVVYFCHEQVSMVTAYNLDPSSGTLSLFQTVSTLPEGFKGESKCAEIRVSASGRTVYVSNRGHDSIAWFASDARTGKLTPIRWLPTEPVPRVFTLSPRGDFLFLTSQETGRMASYRVDELAGTLDHIDTRAVGKLPMWILITPAP